MPKAVDFYSKDQAVDHFAETFDLSGTQFLPKASKTKKKERENRVEVLMRFVMAIHTAAQNDQFTFSGQKPNSFDKLGSYIVSGGRIFFDLNELTLEQRKQFKDFLLPTYVMQGKSKVIKPRLAATHDIVTHHSPDDPTKRISYEKKVHPLHSTGRMIRRIATFAYNAHYGMNIGIGGVGKKIKPIHKNKEITIRNNGNFGHFYVNMPEDLCGIQCGYEEAAPGAEFEPAGGRHGPNGKGAKHSFCLTRRLRDQAFGPNGEDHIIMKEDDNGIYAWNRVVITPNILQQLANLPRDMLDPTKADSLLQIKNILKDPPANCEQNSNYEDRAKAIKEYRRKHRLVHRIKEATDKFDDKLNNSFKQPEQLIEDVGFNHPVVNGHLPEMISVFIGKLENYINPSLNTESWLYKHTKNSYLTAQRKKIANALKDKLNSYFDAFNKLPGEYGKAKHLADLEGKFLSTLNEAITLNNIAHSTFGRSCLDFRKGSFNMLLQNEIKSIHALSGSAVSNKIRKNG